MSTPAMVFGTCRRARKARTLDDGQIEFRPDRLPFFGSLLIACYFAYAAAGHLMSQHRYRNPFDILTSCCIALVSLTIIFSLPGTIIVTAEGLRQFFWLRKKKHIRREDIVEINTGEKSRTVTITGADRTKIVHSGQLPNRPRLLLEIKEHSGENLPSDFPREPLPYS